MWQQDSAGVVFETPDGKPVTSSGTVVATLCGKGGIISGGLVTLNT